MNIRIDTLRLVMFTSGIVIENKLKVAGDIKNRLPDTFDDDPVILPVPENLPPEIPRILLKSKDDRYTLLITKDRVNLEYRYEFNETRSEIPVSEIFEKFLTIFQYVKDDLFGTVIRVVNTQIWKMKLETISPVEYILSKYIREDSPVVRPQRIELHYLTKEVITDFEINKEVYIKTGSKTQLAEKNNFAVFLISVSTSTEKPYRFDRKSLEKFLKESNQVIEETLKNHVSSIKG